LARQMRRFLTGDLSAAVLGFPRFPYGEAAYLRAQIARISAATSISPKGFYEVDPNSGEVEVLVEADAKEYDGLKAEDLWNQPDNWVHHRKHLRKLGCVFCWLALISCSRSRSVCFGVGWRIGERSEDERREGRVSQTLNQCVVVVLCVFGLGWFGLAVGATLSRRWRTTAKTTQRPRKMMSRSKNCSNPSPPMKCPLVCPSTLSVCPCVGCGSVSLQAVHSM
jgi:hypothetical protein